MMSEAREVMLAAWLHWYTGGQTTADEQVQQLGEACLDAQLVALSDAGFVILPREPTDAMVIAATEASQSFMARIDTTEDDYAYAILRAALSAGEEETR